MQPFIITARTQEITSADLGPQLKSFISDLVENGRYDSKSEVLREGILPINQREARLAVLDQTLARSISDEKAGRAVPLAVVVERLEQKYEGAGLAKE